MLAATLCYSIGADVVSRKKGILASISVSIDLVERGLFIFLLFILFGWYARPFVEFGVDLSIAVATIGAQRGELGRT